MAAQKPKNMTKMEAIACEEWDSGGNRITGVKLVSARLLEVRCFRSRSVVKLTFEG